MNSLLNLVFFKSLSFPSKESGMEFIKLNPKLKKQIDEKIIELDEAKYSITESIKEDIFVKYNDKKEVFLIKIKNERNGKLLYKKELQKKALKEEMKAELLQEIKNEEMDEKKTKMMKNYPNAIPVIDKVSLEKINELQDLFFDVIKRIDSGDIEEDNIVIIEKQKANVDRALELLKKAMSVLEKLNNQ